MHKHQGFTLIELVITIAIIALLAAVGFPSYRDHVARGQRSVGQQFLADIAQRQEQFLLDRRQYAGTFAAIGIPKPSDFKYNDPAPWTVDNAASPPTYTICMSPAAGSNLAVRNDGRLCINNVGQRWRETDGDGVFNGSDCLWENRSCSF